MIKQTIKILLVSGLTYLILFGGYSFVSAKYEDFENYQAGYFYVKSKYHEKMNEYFNGKIQHFLEIKPDNKDYSPPENEECDEDNVSTYCVAMGALDLYSKYAASLDQVSAYIWAKNEVPARQPVPVIGDPLGTLVDIFREATNVEQAIDEEKGDALDIMEMTISGYNEFRLAWPMHLKYEEIIVDLTDYRDAIADIRIKTERFPLKFIDATSQSCE
jgi:hypothetical protein